MSRYLIQTQEIWRADSESEAQEIINEAKADNSFTLAKYSNVYKERKLKGEVVDCWYKVTLTKAFTSEKEPDSQTTITYTNQGFFPTVSQEEDNEPED